MNHCLLKLEGHWYPISYKEHPHIGSGPRYQIDIEKRLIDSFVHLPIRHILNTNENGQYLNHIPVIGELTQVLFHIFLIDEFDAKFRKLYPRNPFYRLGTEVILPIPDSYDDLDIDPEKVYNILEWREYVIIL